MRVFMLSYAAQLQPFRSPEVFDQMADALNGDPEKAAGCDVSAEVRRRGLTFGTPGASLFAQPASSSAASLTDAFNATAYFVDPVSGSDANPGSLSAPFLTIERALQATRSTPTTNDTIVLRAGTFYQNATIVLTTADSGLTIRAYPGEEVWISGAQPVSLTWSPYNVNATDVWEVFQNTNAIFGDVPSSFVILNGTYSNAQACNSACQANYSAGGPCTIWTWHDQNQGSYALQCYFRIDNEWSPQYESGHTSGYLARGPNVWSASLAGTGITSVPGLRLNGGRMVRARFPNANPELGFGPTFNAAWTPQSAPRLPDVQIDLKEPVRNTSVSAFQTFTAGIGGTCDRFQPPAGYWCSTNVQGGGSTIFYSPTAMQVNASQLPHLPYADPTGAVIQTWRNGHWASWMYSVGSWTYDEATTFANFTFAYGGFQGSRGDDSASGTYIENVFEELDAPAEWFYNESSQELYFWMNATAGTPPPSNSSLQIPQVKNLFNVTGDSMEDPVRDVSFIGLGFRDTAYTYFDPHTFPSGGDWTIARSGVVTITNSERTLVSGCVFSRVDGNAVLIQSYNRNTTIEYNAFEWLGESAIVSVGDTEGGDDRLPFGYGLYGTNGTQPRGSRIRFNTCRELGIWEKQSSFYTTFKSGRNTVEGNLVWNGPRAHVNVNDGFMGGNLFDRNVLINSCRESGDHGPVNSWDRDVYLWDALDGSTTFVKDPDVFTRNALLGDYSTLCAVDNDDGSSYFTVHNNFMAYGGCAAKNDFEGHDGHHYANLYAYMGMGLDNGYGGNIGPNLDGHEDQFYANYVVLNQDGNYVLPVCSGTGKSVIANNTVFTPTGSITECGATLAAWQAAGNDPGTTAAPYPPTSTLLGIAQELLGVSLEL